MNPKHNSVPRPVAIWQVGSVPITPKLAGIQSRENDTEARIARLLGNRLEQNPQVAGDVLSGEAGAILAQQPDTTVGIDAVVFSLETLRGQEPDIPSQSTS